MPRYAFDTFELDTDEATLVGPDGAVSVERQVFDVLAYLIERAGSLVTKNDLLDNVWGDRFVAESSLTSRIYAARKAVGDTGRAQAVIKTVHGRGYRFLPDVRVIGGEPTPSPTAAVPIAEPGRLPPSLESQTRARCVGRGAQLEQAIEMLDEGRHPGAGLLWVVGEPGIGKTRLARELVRVAEGRDFRALWSRCWEGEGAPSLWPWSGIVRKALAD
ncbi:MAG: winged helix-turn-helix domain-containing protein, partial [Acidimicrobiales bacterium]